MHSFHTGVLVLATPCVYVQVQQNLKAVFLAYPATPVPDPGDSSSTSEQSTNRYVRTHVHAIIARCRYVSIKVIGTNQCVCLFWPWFNINIWWTMSQEH